MICLLSEGGKLGLLPGLGAPNMTPTGVDLSFLFFLSDEKSKRKFAR